MVHPGGIEPPSMVPKTTTLSVKLRVRIETMIFYQKLLKLAEVL